MDKAILVIDMPKCCDDCDFCYYSDGRVPICFYKSWVVDEPKAKPDWCPLKPAPEEQLVWCDDDWSAWERGYNSCLHEIIGEEDDG